jgi:hypothetical protein
LFGLDTAYDVHFIVAGNTRKCGSGVYSRFFEGRDFGGIGVQHETLFQVFRGVLGPTAVLVYKDRFHGRVLQQSGQGQPEFPSPRKDDLLEALSPPDHDPVEEQIYFLGRKNNINIVSRVDNRVAVWNGKLAFLYESYETHLAEPLIGPEILQGPAGERSHLRQPQANGGYLVIQEGGYLERSGAVEHIEDLSGAFFLVHQRAVHAQVGDVHKR